MATTTRIKSKIGSHLSYPCTLVELDRSVSPASERHELEVLFSDWKAPRPNEVRENYTVLEARYSSRIWGEHAGEWRYEIAVYPVPRTLRAQVRALLFPAGTGRVREWLLAERPPIWYSSPHRITAHFDALADELSFREHPKA